MNKNDDQETSRRSFFRQALRQVLEPVIDYVDERQNQIKSQLVVNSNLVDELPVSPFSYYLRPPGALTESEFIQTCQKSGSCISACPAEAIFINESDQLPYLDPDRQPCVVCDSLACMTVCPSGALQPTPVEEISVGLAVVNYGLCLNTEGIECQACVELCPLGDSAIRFDTENQEVEVIESGCIGCGVCQYQCPTYPKSIFVRKNLEF